MWSRGVAQVRDAGEEAQGAARDEGAVACVHLAPGALLEPGFFVRLNGSALAHEAVVYVVHNDGYADGVPLPLAFANPCLADLAPAFRLRGARVWGAEALAEAIARAKGVCAAGHGPVWIEAMEGAAGAAGGGGLA